VVIGRSDVLSRREREVIKLVCSGYTNKEIGKELGITTTTARNYIVSIMNKLGARNRAHAAAIAVSSGLVPEGEKDADI
jgi:DNA-binding NarL/FixJ family response regulator